MGSREGNVTSFASLSLASRTDSLSIGTSYTSGVSGRSVDLSSAYSGSGDHASILHDIHVLTSAGIMQLTDRYAGRLYMDATSASGLGASGMASFLRVPPVVRAMIILKDIDDRCNEYLRKQSAEEADAKVAGEKSTSSAATGGMPDPDDEEERKTNCSKSESPVWKAAQPFKGQYKRNAKGDEIYKWDYTHNEIEVFNSRGQHVGVKDPLTGLKIKDAVPGRVEIGIK